MRIVGIETTGEAPRKGTLTIDMYVAQLVRQVARAERKNITQCVSDMLHVYVHHQHPDWRLVTEEKKPTKQPKKARKR
jgi:hypothetical protein